MLAIICILSALLLVSVATIAFLLRRSKVKSAAHKADRKRIALKMRTEKRLRKSERDKNTGLNIRVQNLTQEVASLMEEKRNLKVELAVERRFRKKIEGELGQKVVENSQLIAEKARLEAQIIEHNHRRCRRKWLRFGGGVLVSLIFFLIHLHYQDQNATPPFQLTLEATLLSGWLGINATFS